MKVLNIILNVLFYMAIVFCCVVGISVMTQKPVVHDDREMYKMIYIRHLEDSIIKVTGRGSIDTMYLDTVKMNKIFSDIFPEK